MIFPVCGSSSLRRGVFYVFIRDLAYSASGNGFFHGPWFLLRGSGARILVLLPNGQK